MENVDAEKKQYTDMKASWKKIRDCVGGARLIKGDDTDQTYLPMPNPQDQDPVKYAAYKQRAIFYNTTDRTLNALAGAVLRKPPKVELPSELEYMETDADGAGASIEEVAKFILFEVLELSRCGILVDFPKIDEEPLTLAREQELALRSNLIAYVAESIINWRESRVGAEMVLSLVVLKEAHDVAKDKFVEDEQTFYRVLALDEKGDYYHELYSQNNIKGEGSSEGGFSLVEDRIYPRDSDGNLLRRIPFIFVGAMDLKPPVEKPLLMDIVEVNLGHYRNSADFEEMVFMTGQPTLIVSGLTKTWVDGVWKGKPLTVGARSAIELPVGGSAEFVQIAESSIANTAMIRKEEQMISLGARVITSMKGGVEASDTVRLRIGGEASILNNVADNVSQAVTRALRYATGFMGGNPEDALFEFNEDFFAEVLSLEQAKIIMEAWQSGIMAKPDVRDAYRKGEIIRKDREDEDIDRDLEDEEGEIPSLDGLDEDDTGDANE